MDDVSSPSAEGNPRAVSVRLQKLKRGQLDHNRRHDMRIGIQPSYVDPARRDLNRVLLSTPTQRATTAEAQRRYSLRSKRRLRTDANISVSAIITFGAKAQILFERLPLAAQDAAYREVAEGVAAALGTDLDALVVHADESAPHCHFRMNAYDREGRPVKRRITPTFLAGVQDLAAETMNRHCPGVERGHRKATRLAAGADPADLRGTTVAEKHRRLGLEPGAAPDEVSRAVGQKRRAEAERDAARTARDRLQAETTAVLDVLKETRAMARAAALVETDPDGALREAAAVVAAMRQRVEALEAKEALTEKETRRLAIYRPRLATYERCERDVQALVDLTAKRESLAADREEVERERADVMKDRAALTKDREIHDRVQAGFANAVEAIAAGHALPRPSPNDWMQGPRPDGFKAAMQKLRPIRFARRTWAALCVMAAGVMGRSVFGAEAREEVRAGEGSELDRIMPDIVSAKPVVTPDTDQGPPGP